MERRFPETNSIRAVSSTGIQSFSGTRENSRSDSPRFNFQKDRNFIVGVEGKSNTTILLLMKKNGQKHFPRDRHNIKWAKESRSHRLSKDGGIGMTPFRKIQKHELIKVSVNRQVGKNKTATAIQFAYTWRATELNFYFNLHKIISQEGSRGCVTEEAHSV